VVCGTVGDHTAVLDWWLLLVGTGLVALRSRQALVVENLLLQQQLAVTLRTRRRPHVRWHDRLFWVIARRLVTDWRRHLVLVRPETVLHWHRQGWSLV
jgi:putative transposase